MKSMMCYFTLAILLQFYFISSHSQTICNDTIGWTNHYGGSCYEYEHNISNYWICNNGTYTVGSSFYGGNTFGYAEYNCCGCGKGWPLWFVPVSGYTATKAVPEATMTTINKSISMNLMCNDTYRNVTNCTMRCKTLPDGLSVSSITTMSSEDFNVTNCLLNLNPLSDPVSYILQIPVDNYLIYFTDWATDEYNFSCVTNTSIVNSHMLCRYEVDTSPFVQPQCPSESITDRYIKPGCIDTNNWTDPQGYTCFEYEVIGLWCANGKFTQSWSWIGGARYNYPEKNCCACGKGMLSPFQSLSTSRTNNSLDSLRTGVIHLVNCILQATNTYVFDFMCLGPLNFTSTNLAMNATLYNCPLDCSFNWNTTKINLDQSINVTRQSYGSLVSYYLVSELFPNFNVNCTSPVDQEPMIISSSPPSTSSQLSFTSSDLIVSSTSAITYATTSTRPITSQASTHSLVAVNQSGDWQPPICANENIGLQCNISADPCAMSQPCLNNGTCSTSDSSYICSCPPSQFTGANCEIDIRPCKPYTCLSYGICIETSLTSFLCQCEAGYEGIHCESLTDFCLNVTCQNNGQCRPGRLNFTCDCTTKDYSGRYCELSSSFLVTKKIINRSFASIAILALVFVGGFIVSMDVLKYGFSIDPVEKIRRQTHEQKRKKPRKKRRTTIALRFTYVNSSSSHQTVSVEHKV